MSPSIHAHRRGQGARGRSQPTRQLWDAHREVLPPAPAQDRRVEEFVAGYPLHPELVKHADAEDRARSATSSACAACCACSPAPWRACGRRGLPMPTPSTHTTSTSASSRSALELVTRLKQRHLRAGPQGRDRDHRGDAGAGAADSTPAPIRACRPTVRTWPAPSSCTRWRSTTPCVGSEPEELRYAILGPGTDIAFIDDARKRFVTDSAYLDDKPEGAAALPGRGQPDPDHPARGNQHRSGRGSVPAQRLHPRSVRWPVAQPRAVRLGSARRARRRRQRPPLPRAGRLRCRASVSGDAVRLDPARRENLPAPRRRQRLAPQPQQRDLRAGGGGEHPAT